jgi:hypothetical protein
VPTEISHATIKCRSRLCLLLRSLPKTFLFFIELISGHILPEKNIHIAMKNLISAQQVVEEERSINHPSGQVQDTREAFDAIQTEFYGALVLLSLMNPFQKSSGSLETLSSGSRPKKDGWHKFLDHLSMIADYGTGGRTVSAILVQDISPHPKYWYVNHGDLKNEAFNHIKWTLNELQHSCNLSPDGSLKLYTRIAQRSIAIAPLKIALHRTKLGSIMFNALNSSPSRDGNSNHNNMPSRNIRV